MIRRLPQKGSSFLGRSGGLGQFGEVGFLGAAQGKMGADNLLWVGESRHELWGIKETKFSH